MKAMKKVISLTMTAAMLVPCVSALADSDTAKRTIVVDGGVIGRTSTLQNPWRKATLTRIRTMSWRS